MTSSSVSYGDTAEQTRRASADGGRAFLGATRSPGASAVMAVAATCLFACGGLGGPSSADERETALLHAQASVLFQGSQARLEAAGWELGLAQVERFSAPADQKGPTGTEASPSGAPGLWTRVTVPVSRQGAPGQAPSKGGLLLAWLDGGSDVFAIHAATEAITQQLLAAVDDPPSTTAPAPPPGLEPPAQVSSISSALTCNREGASCAGSHSCCFGLSCFGPDNHETCNCAQPWSQEYPDGATASPACFALFGNPFGLGYWRKRINGCGFSGLASNQCGQTVGVPAYYRSTSRWLVCRASSPC
jgi:hypothetical protein